MPAKIVALLLLIASTTTTTWAAAAESSKAPAAAAAPNAGDACRRLPDDKRLKLNLKPNTDLVDLVSWISAITCKQFIVPGTIPAQSKTVTIVSPQPITSAEAYRLFLDALDSVGLTVYPAGKVLRVIETSKVKSAPIPFLVDDDRD